jgi:hypothetical protein
VSLSHFRSPSVIIRKLFFHLFDLPNSRLANSFSHQKSVRSPVCTYVRVCVCVCVCVYIYTHTHISYTSMNILNIITYSHSFLHFLQLLSVNFVFLNSVSLIFLVKISYLSVPFNSLSTFSHNSIYYFTSSYIKRIIKCRTIPTYLYLELKCYLIFFLDVSV